MSIIEVPELREVVVGVEVVPECQLVHLDVASVGGFILTAAQAHALADDLRRAAGRASRVRARPRARSRAAAA